MTATLERTPARTAVEKPHRGRRGYLVAAGCLAIASVMLLPLLYSVLASIKPTAEAAAPEAIGRRIPAERATVRRRRRRTWRAAAAAKTWSR